MTADDGEAGGEVGVEVVVPFYRVAEVEEDWFAHFGRRQCGMYALLECWVEVRLEVHETDAGEVNELR